MFIHFDAIHERDRHQTDAQTDGHRSTYSKGRACSLARLISDDSVAAIADTMSPQRKRATKIRLEKTPRERNVDSRFRSQF